MVPESTRVFSREDFSSEEFDIDFEYDAPRFYDFSRAELDSETEDIETWFELSGNYPPSPFSPKFNWQFEPIEQITSTISEPKIVESSDNALIRKDKYNGFIYYNQTAKDVTKTKPKPKSTSKPISSTLTRPTVSLLARQNKPLDIYSVQLLTKCQRSLGRFGDNLSLLLASKLQNQDTKKQKLDAKVAQANSNRRSKLTVPKEPKLRTAERSERHRSKVNSETAQNAKSRINSSKKNTNISLEPSSTTLLKSIKRQSHDLQAFRLRTSMRAKEHSFNAKIEATHKHEPTNTKTLKPIDSSKSKIVKDNNNRRINCQMYESNTFPLDSKRSIREKTGEANSIKYRTYTNRSLDLCRKFNSHEVAGSLIIA
ncbi:unnamed protein product [Cochlearia groenlandica]